MQALDTAIDELLAHPRFDLAAQGLAHGFNAVQESSPRLASLFSTQQRWLMSHVALALHFEGLLAGRPGFSRLAFLDGVVANRLASRNTAAAFFAEALHYGVALPIGPDVAEPAPATLLALGEWYRLHLGALDALDGGDRAGRLRNDDGRVLAAMEPAVAEGLFACDVIREPTPLYGVFASVDEGGSLMDRLMIGLDPATASLEDRAVTNVTSVSALASRLNLSRTHAGRTLAAAIASGGLGWSGKPGRSPIWVSRRFRAEYAQVQASKLAIIDGAFQAAARPSLPPSPLAGLVRPEVDEPRAH